MEPKPGATDPMTEPPTSDNLQRSGVRGNMDHPRWRYRVDREHPIGGEMSDIVGGIFTRLRLPWLLRHHSGTPVLAIFSFINGCISIGIMSALALVTHSAFVFPSLGPTAFLFFYTPSAPSASPRNTIVGHAIGVLAGYFSLVVTGLTLAGPALTVGVTWPRVIAAALSLGLTAGLMVLLKSPHPPAGATTLIISLGLLTKPLQLLILMAAVVLLTLQAIIINRLSGMPYPLWNPRRDPDEDARKTAAQTKPG
ncbi:MAG TPA: HPP family protein [Ktedonobacteraceae bacterium]|nr:HPP family protein [Ktedonobacteraceae bacterium]